MAVPSAKFNHLYDHSPVFLQNLMSSAFGLVKLLDERGRRFRTIYSELIETQWWDRERLRQLQRERLRNILRFAQEHVPFYRKRFAEYGVSWNQVQAVEDLSRFPLLTKEDIRSHPQELIADVKPNSRIIAQSTSGTTGSPLRVLMDHTTLVTERAWVARHRTWGDYDARSWRGTFGGYKVVPMKQDRPPFWRYNLPWRQIHFSTFHLSEKNLPHYAAALRSTGVQFLDGYPSTLYLMARYLRATGQSIPMKAVFTGSEPLYELYRETIEAAFACKVFDYYALTERVISAGECSRHSGFHLSMEHVVAETIPPEGGAKDNEPVRELVGTSLVNTVMPLIRYRTGDVVSPPPDQCSCGRGLEVIGQVKTKSEDFVVCPDGRHISASNLTYPFKPIQSIAESQIVQENPSEVVVRIIRRPEYTEADEKRLLEGLRERLGPTVAVRAEYVQEISRTSAGKFRFVISHVESQLLVSRDRKE